MSASALFVRDRFTWLTYLQLATWGYFLYGFTPSVTLLRDDENVSRAISGLHGTGLAVGAVAVGFVAPRLTLRLGRVRLMRIALSTMCVGVIVVVSCKIVAVTITGAIIAGFGGSLVVNLSSSMLTAHHRGAAGSTAVTEANGISTSFGIFAPLMISAAIALGIGWRPGLLVTIALVIAVVVGSGKAAVGDHVAAVGASRPVVRHRMSSRFWWGCGALVMMTAIEFSMTIWSSDVLQNHDGLSKGLAATGVTAIVVGMSIGRLASGRLALRYSADSLLFAVFAVTLIGFAAFWSSSIPWLGFAGLFVVGLGISLQFPLGITRVIRFSEGHPDLATSYGSLATGFAIGLAPFGLGAIADHVGSHTAMLVVPVFVVLAALGVSVSMRASESSRPLADAVTADFRGVIE